MHPPRSSWCARCFECRTRPALGFLRKWTCVATGVAALFSAPALRGETEGAKPPVHVADFGAVPGDSQCDTQAIQEAIDTAIREGRSEVRFAAGVYDLIQTTTRKKSDAYLVIDKAKGLALVGAVDEGGRPATRIVRVMELNNDTTPTTQIEVQDSEDITIRNFVLTNNPPLGSTARVLSVNREKDEVVVEALEGLPAYDGMRAASAQVTDSAGGHLKRFGASAQEATLTIGTAVNVFWKAVPGTEGRRLQMTGAGWSAKVMPGDLISWHHKASEAENQTKIMRVRNFLFENIVMPNVSNMGMLAAYCDNLVFRKVRFEPEHGNLAIGGRDGLHLSNNAGELLVEDCYFKGLRMDPLVIRRTFGVVKAVEENGQVTIEPAYEIPAGDVLRVWTGDEPTDLTVDSSRRVRSSVYEYRFREPLPQEMKVGSVVSFQTFSLKRGIIRNTVFEDNFGSPIVNFEENITIEGCVFNNNSYQLKFGPNVSSGGWARNCAIRNNEFNNISWIDIAGRKQPAFIVIHSLSSLFTNPMFNKSIGISGNRFTGDGTPSNAVAIDVRNATDVTIKDNMFQGIPKNVAIDPKTTRNINVRD